MIVISTSLIIAAAAAFVFSFIWFKIFGKSWMLARGWKKIGRRTVPFSSILAILIVEFILALVLASILPTTAGAGYGWQGAIAAAAFLWFGFTLAPMLINGTFSHTRLKVTLIECFHWLGVVVLESLVLSLWK